MKPTFFITALLIPAAPIFLMTVPEVTYGQWNEQSPVSHVLKELGDPMPAHYLSIRDEQMAKRGEDIIKFGLTRRPDGRPSTKQSRYFVCTDCHNVRREDPDLRNSDPDSRLEYAIQHRLRFLPATTFYGIVNRTSWYNGDYQKKYGKAAAKAHTNLIEAIQLCATQCAMGRKLQDWELRAVLEYFWSLELQLQDLSLTQSDLKKLNAQSLPPRDTKSLITWLKALYIQASPATFSDPPAPVTASDHDVPDLGKGQALYVLSCMSCHQADKTTSLTLGHSPAIYRLLKDHTEFNAHLSIFRAVRHGIKASPGKAYMPNFPVQRMSDRQLRDLQGFITFQATHTPLPLEPFIDWIQDNPYSSNVLP